MENIVSALISAVAAVVVALISRTQGKAEERANVARLRPSSHGKWIGAMAVLAGWLVVSPIAIHHDFPGINMFGLVAATLIIAAVWPIYGLEAAAWVFALHALNSVAEPIARLVTGKYQGDAFGGYRLQLILLMGTIAFVNAGGVGLLSGWRLRTNPRASQGNSSTQAAVPLAVGKGASNSWPTANPDFIAQLERLAKLRDAGGLSEAEYNKAKQRILGALDGSEP